MFRFIMLLGLVSCSSCRKTLSSAKYIITGTLLESSSNPVPVKNYSIQASQRNDYGLLGGVSGLREVFHTDVNGYFSFIYSPKAGTGFSSGSINIYPLELTGIDTIGYKNLYPDWSPVSANKDTSMGKIFLFKRIEKFVRKVQFNTGLSSGDSLEVITSQAYQASYKTLHGPIPAGTLLILDTLNNLKVERLDISSQQYYTFSTLKKTSYQHNFNLVLLPGDEAYREQVLAYP